MLILFLVILHIFAINDDVKSGVKIAFPQYTIDYMVPKLVAMGQKMISVDVPDQNVQVQTPVGEVKLSLSKFKLDSFNASKPSCQIIPNNELKLGSTSLGVSADASFGYKTDKGPQTGTVHFEMIGSFSLDIGAKIDPSHPSNLKIVSTGFDLHFDKFTVQVKGGDPWLEAVLEKLMSASLLNLLIGIIQSKVPGMIENLGQKALDSIKFTSDLGYCDVSFSYKFGTFMLSSSQGGFISLGSEGVFKKPGITLKGSAADIPDYIPGKNEMLEMFFSSFSFNSLSQDVVFGKCLNYTIKDMFFLKTSYFKDLIPNLPYRYPDKKMEIMFFFENSAPPNFTFDGASKKMKLYLDLDHVWNVILKVEGPMEAFTLTTKLEFEGEFSVKQQQGANRLSGELNLVNVQTTLKRSFVGPFNVTGLSTIISTIFTGLVAPILNAAFEWGISLPLIPYTSLVNPSVIVKDGYMQIMTSFKFEPPLEMKDFEVKE